MTKYASGSGTVVTYAWMWKSAKHALTNAQSSQEGQFFEAMNVLAFSAFAMEAFLNHAGAKVFEDWIKRERRLSKFKKLEKLTKFLHISPNFKTRPYCSVIDAFTFRDTIAHGRTEKNEFATAINPSITDPAYFAESEWMSMCTLGTAQRIFADIEEVIQKLFASAELGTNAFLHFYSSSYSIESDE